MENKKECLVTLVMKDAAIPLGHFSKEVADLMKKEIEYQIQTSISKHVEGVIVC